MSNANAKTPKIALVLNGKAVLVVASVPSGLLYTLYKLPATPFDSLAVLSSGNASDFVNAKLDSLSTVFNGSCVLLCDVSASCVVYQIAALGQLARLAAFALQPPSSEYGPSPCLLASLHLNSCF